MTRVVAPLALGWTLLTVFSVAGAAEPPNILWVILDDCRADAFGCYGQPWASTPNFDRIAERGVRFETAIVQSMVCQPSRHSFLTGHYPHRLRHMAMGPPADPPPMYFRGEVPTARLDLPAVLASLGMRPLTVGKTHHGHWEQIEYDKPPRVDPNYKPDRGRVYSQVELVAPQKFPPRRAGTRRRWLIGGTELRRVEDSRPARITDAALKTLAGLCQKKQPFFLRVSYHAPHIPIQVPAEFMPDPESIRLPYPTDEELASKPYFERHALHQYAGTTHMKREDLQVARATYYGMVSLVDAQFGRIVRYLEEQGQLDNTLIAVNADHGLQLGEHGLHKKRSFYEQTVAVPFLFAWPGRLPHGKVIREPIEFLDFLPTVFDLVGVPVPAGIAGRSLVPLIRGEVKEWRKAVFCEIDHARSYYTALRVHTGRRIMVRTKEWKMIYFRDPRVPSKDGALYHLLEDPGETRNLYADPRHADVREELERLVDAWDERQE
jgi:arylsulfatase A-like enzyme